MPNGVKYSTTTPSGSLRRDNVALGVNGNLGPTANTGFYSMPTPASGKYIINKVAVSGVPLFFAPQNDTELIQLARNEGATGANTGSAAAVLSWIATQPNLEAANFEYPNIVTDGLVLNLDAGFVGSYPTINTTWYDISGNANNGALTNGPTFNSANSGSIVFDGIDDYATIPNFDYGRTGFTAEAWIMYTANTNSNKVAAIGSWETGGARNNQWLLFSEGAGGIAPGYPYFGIQSTSNNLYFAVDTNTIMTINTWYQLCGVFDGTSVKVYLNSSIKNTNNIGSTVTVYNNNNPIGIASFANGNYNTQCKIAITRIYNRALTAAEVLQNYNAQKSRFGL
jgi:hypothetical protein